MPILQRKLRLQLNGKVKSEAVKWHGEPLEDEYSTKKKYYAGFNIGSLNVDVGDAVLIKNYDANNPESLDECNLGRVIKCYILSSGKMTSNHATVENYLTTKISYAARQRSVKKLDVPPLDKNIEVIKLSRNHDIDVRTILGKCVISEVDIDEEPSLVKPPKDCFDRHYVCRFSMIQNNKLTPLKAKPSITNEPLQDISNKQVRRSLASELILASPIANIENTNLKSSTSSMSPQKDESLGNGHIISKKLSVMLERVDDQLIKQKTATKRLLNESDHENRKKSKYSQEESVDECLDVKDRKILGNIDLNVNSPQNKKGNYVGTGRSLSKNQILDLLSNDDDDNNIFEEVPKTNRRPGRPPKISTEIKSQRQTRRSTYLREEFSSDEQEIIKPKENILSPEWKPNSKNGTPNSKYGTPSRRKRVTKVKDVTDTFCTPSRLNKKKTENNNTPKRKGSVSKKSLLNTPILKNRLNPPKNPQTPLEEARSRLHVSAVPDTLPCREKEFEEIYSFIEGKLFDGTGGCMYVSGVPGTGKTATVREVVKLLKECQATEELPSFKYLELNAMKLTEPHQLWVQIWQGLTGQKVTASHASTLLQSRFSTPNARREPTLLLVDELDLLWTRKQDVMYNLFDWPSRTGSKLIVVAIANTMDLPERIMINRVSSRLGLTRMTFQPYNFEQLKTIVSSRLKGIKGFDPDGIELVSRKVAALSGDARRALDICRRATEVAELGICPASPSKSPKRNILVGILHVNKALEEMFSSPKIMAIRSCSLYQKHLLEAIVAEFIRKGVEEAVLSRVLEQFQSICRIHGKGVPCFSVIMLMLNTLSSRRLVLTEHGRTDLLMRIRLNISTDDVTYAINSATQI